MTTRSPDASAGTISTRQISLVRQTWALVAPVGPEAIRLFYARLFEIDPTLRSLFARDMEKQHGALLSALDGAVGALDSLDELMASLAVLGARHAELGVKRHDFDSAGEALLSTLERCLGQAFTPPVRDAWAATYEALAGAMQAGFRCRALGPCQR